MWPCWPACIDEPPEASKDKGERKDKKDKGKKGKKGKGKKGKKGKKQRDNEEALASGSPDGDGPESGEGEAAQTEANPMGARLL